MTAEIIGQQEALEAVEANRSARYRELDKLERYVETTQYDGLQDWFASGPQAKPLLERKPCIAYTIVANGIDSNVDLLLGSGRFPSTKLTPPFESEVTGEDGDGDDDLKTLTTGIDDAIKQSRFRVAAAEVFKGGQSCGTGVSIYGVRNGRLFIDTTKAKWCTPEFDVDGRVSSLEIRYPYVVSERRPDGTIKQTAKLYRRVIDGTSDVTFLPADADKQGREPKWVADKRQSFEHGLGRCPVIWYAHMRGCAAVNEIDGKAIHARVLDEVFALDVSLSQRHRAALMAGDPQWTEVGVEERSGPRANGRAPNPNALLATAKGGFPSSSNPVIGDWEPRTPAKARKKGPGETWTYSDPNVKVQLHTLPGDALQAISEHANDLRAKIAEGLAVVFTDTDSVKFASSMSAKAMEALKGRQLDRVDQYREDFGNGWFIPQLQGLLEVILAKADSLRLRNAQDIRDSLGVLGGVPDIELGWGPYFKSTPEDEQKLIECAEAAHEAGFATLEMCVRKLAPLFGITDVEEILEKLEEEADEKASREDDKLLAEQKAMAAISGAMKRPAATEQEPKPNALPGADATGD
jgi:hypothetical protein